MPGGYGVSSTLVTRPSSSSISTRSISRCAMHANASDGFIAGCMSDRYISVVTPRDVVGLVHVVDLLAEIAQAHALVLRLLGDELRQDPPQRLVLVVVVLELLQRGHQRVPAALGDADREHDEERVEPGLLDDDAVLGQDTW